MATTTQLAPAPTLEELANTVHQLEDKLAQKFDQLEQMLVRMTSSPADGKPNGSASSSGDTTSSSTASSDSSSGHPILDYIAASVLFSTGYLALEPRQRRGASRLLPFIPAAVGVIDVLKHPKSGDKLVGTGLSAAAGLGTLLFGAR